jgi:fructan beta-fructosidase
MIAIFTQHLMAREKAGRNDFQTQGIAYSHDKGRTWQIYEGNPVIPNPGIKDFRDPKVFWHKQSEQWVMIFAAGDRVKLYGSPNLKDWEFLSDFGSEYGAHGGVWECPDLFQLKVEGSDKQQWVMLVSINPGGPNGGSATQYFVGYFDGKSFTTSQTKDDIKWLDFGRDNYAGVTWSDVPQSDSRRLFMGWMSNWDYAQVVPTETWRSAMTLPRSLHLVNTQQGFVVASRPVSEIQTLHSQAINFGEVTLDEESVFLINSRDDSTAAIVPPFRTEILFDHANSTTTEYGLILQNEIGDLYRLYFKEGYLWSDRMYAGNKDFEERFARTVHRSNPVQPDAQGKIRLEVIFDISSAEIFVNDGETVMTELLFPNTPFNQTYIYTLDGNLKFDGFKTTRLKSIWQP